MGIERINWKGMAGKKSILIYLMFIGLGLLNCTQAESQNQNILQILNSNGVNAEHKNTLPLWGKYTYNDRNSEQRAFLLFSDGSIYNYSNSDENPDTSWKNWGIIEDKFIRKIENKIIELHKITQNQKSSLIVDNKSVLIQYKLEEASNLTIISKNYNSDKGKYLKKINDIINEALASRSEKK